MSGVHSDAKGWRRMTTRVTASARVPQSSVAVLVVLVGCWLFSLGTGGLASIYAMPTSIRYVGLGLVAIACLHLILGVVLGAHRIAWAGVAFALPPVAAFVASLVKLDVSALVASSITALVVLGLGAAPSQGLVRAFKVYLAASLVASLALAALVPHSNIPGRDFLPLVVEGRAAGVFGHPNMLGVHAAIALICGLLHARKSSGKLLVLLGAVALLASASQTSILGVLAALSWVCILLATRKWGGSGAAGSAILGGAAIYFAIGQVGLFSGEAISSADLTFTNRTVIWESILRQEVGWVGLTDAEFTQVVQLAYGVGSAHNLWLEYWGRYGILGLGATIVMFAWLVRRATSRSGRLAAVVVFLAVTSLMEGVLLALPLITIFLAAFIWCSSAWSQSTTAGPRLVEPSFARSK